jgi:hypothetical protein
LRRCNGDDQGDQMMSLWQNRPKWSPTRILSQ